MHAFAALLMLVSIAAPAHDRGNIVVHVRYDSISLPGVTVKAGDATHISGADGDAILSNIEPGNYTVSAELEGFQRTMRKNVVVRAGETAVVEVVMRTQPEIREICVDCNGDPPFPDGPSFTVTRRMLETLPF